MKFSLLLITTLAAVASSPVRTPTTTTELPCPMICIRGQPPVCAEISPGMYIRYSGECMQHTCECLLDTRFPQVDMSKCRGALIDMCPLRVAAAQATADDDSEEESLSA